MLLRKFELIEEAHAIVVKREAEAKMAKVEARGAKQISNIFKRKAEVEPSNVARKRRESRSIGEKMSGLSSMLGFRK